LFTTEPFAALINVLSGTLRRAITATTPIEITRSLYNSVPNSSKEMGSHMESHEELDQDYATETQVSLERLKSCRSMIKQTEDNCKAVECLFSTIRENLALVLTSSVYEDAKKHRLSEERDKQLARVEDLQKSLNEMRQKLRSIISANNSFATESLIDQTVGSSMACYVDHQLSHFLEEQLPYIRRRFIYGLGNSLVDKIWSGHRSLQERVIHMREEQCALESTLQQDSQIEEKLLEHDTYIISVLDDYFKRQQLALSEMMVPGFFVTDNPIDIEVQMLILEFILHVRCMFAFGFDTYFIRMSSFILLMASVLDLS
uniref:Exocyst complex component Sec8 n=1 Tax=Angiostrongylus cantonensis TaxID=6313 RepID=A0A0K0D221_ANGCA